MSTYVLAYTGGGMAETEEEQAAVMAAWGAWMGGLGDAIVDAGNPFGPSAVVASDGAVSQGASFTATGIVTTDFTVASRSRWRSSISRAELRSSAGPRG